MTTQDTIALAATIRDEAERLENQHLGQSGFTTHTMRCQTLYLKLCGQAAGEALPDARVIAAALKVTEALGETDVTKIRVPSVLALALLNLERVVRRSSGEELKQSLKDVERHPVGPDDTRTYSIERRANGKGESCPTGDWEDVVLPAEEINQALQILCKLCDKPALASSQALAGLRELLFSAKKTEAAFADTLAKKCDELAAENKKLRAERDAAEIERDRLNLRLAEELGEA